MSNSEQESKNSTEVIPSKSPSSLISFDEFDNFFDDFLLRRWPRIPDLGVFYALGKEYPKMDIIDHDEEIEIQAALPGVNKEDLDVSITNQSITIRTCRKKEEKEEGKYFRREITRGEFLRTLSLPDNVDSDKAKATFENGLLKLTIPKMEKSKHKRIEIK